MKDNIKNTSPPKGQISIFVILIFQTLFILFAMSVNVTLLVSDKINLQNSIDIATYYGATKQAEMMNAIAHINYQIRQSWKLLSWRYRVLGSMSITQNAVLQEKPFIPYPYITTPKKRGPYFFCIIHHNWGALENGFVNLEDNFCNTIGQTIPVFNVPKISAVLGSLKSAIGDLFTIGKASQRNVYDKCKRYSYNSWFFGIMSFIQFYRDQSARKFMIFQLAKLMAEGKDLDGNLISEGVRKTFYKNLNFTNKKTFESNPNQLKQFNSLQNVAPTKWLKDNSFDIIGLYAEFISNSKKGCSKNLNILNVAPKIVTNANGFLQEIGKHPIWPCNQPNQCAPSAGLEKRKPFIIFYSVKVNLQYKYQIFLPFYTDFRIQLKARAFAKPFGGIIGPQEGTDTLLPIKHINQKPVSVLEIDTKYSPNYSRYPGDLLGLSSSYVQAVWGPYIRKHGRINTKVEYYTTKNHDPLASGVPPEPTNITARNWELIAISPDLFDITYFTILPFYTQTYYQKIKKLLAPYAPILRGDLGIHQDKNHTDKGFALWYQIQKPTSKLWNAFPYFKILFYKIKKWDMLLTGWNPQYTKYKSGLHNPQNTSFGKCAKWVNVSHETSSEGLIANGCIYGGRTGFSVKLISKEFLKGFNGATNSFPSGDSDWY